MRKVYIDDWIYGPRRSELQNTMFKPHMTGSGPQAQRSWLDDVVDRTVAAGLPQGGSDLPVWLTYGDEIIYELQTGKEVFELPYFRKDPNNALVWVGKTNLLHVTKNGLDANNPYQQAAHKIIQKIPEAKFLGTVSEEDFLGDVKHFVPSVNNWLDGPTDNKIYHNMVDGKPITPDQMTLLPNMFYVKTPGKNIHGHVLIIPDDMANKTVECNALLKKWGFDKSRTWTISQARKYYEDNKGDERGTWGKVKDWFSRHKILMSSLGAIGALATLGVGIYNNSSAIASAANQVGNAISTGYNKVKNTVSSGIDTVKDSAAKVFSNMFAPGTINPAEQWLSIVENDSFQGRHPLCIQRDEAATSFVYGETKGINWTFGDAYDFKSSKMGKALNWVLRRTNPEDKRKEENEQPPEEQDFERGVNYNNPDVKHLNEPPVDENGDVIPPDEQVESNEPFSPLLNPDITPEDTVPENLAGRIIYRIDDFKTATGAPVSTEKLMKEFIFVLLAAANGGTPINPNRIYKLDHIITYDHVRMLLDCLFPKLCFTDRFLDYVFCASSVLCLATRPNWEGYNYPAATVFSSKELIPYNSINCDDLWKQCGGSIQRYRGSLFPKSLKDRYWTFHPTKEQCMAREKNAMSYWETIKEAGTNLLERAGNDVNQFAHDELDLIEQARDTSKSMAVDDMRTDKYASYADQPGKFWKKLSPQSKQLYREVGKVVKSGAKTATSAASNVKYIGPVMSWVSSLL